MTGSNNRARTERQSGFVLVSVLVLALLYLLLIELVLTESSAAMQSAQRYRSRIVADVMAENGAELAARGMVGASSGSASRVLSDGEAEGTYHRLAGNHFEITGVGRSTGVEPRGAEVRIEGRVSGSQIVIERSIHERSGAGIVESGGNSP